MRTRHFIILALTALLPATLAAQFSTANSSYSRYGLGTLDEQSQSYNRGMGGVYQGLRDGGRVNMLNPASYSAIDSLSFIFDVGMTMQYGHFSTKGNSSNAKNATLSNINAGFRVARGLGMSFGFVPFSSIGYNFETEGRVGNGYTTSKNITTKTTYVGNGGVHQIYLGAGWNPIADLSVGANVSYIWGEYSHNMAQAFYEGTSISSSYIPLNNTYFANINSYKVDFGVQYPVRLNKSDIITIGATYGLGHTLNNDAMMNRFTASSDTISKTTKNAFSIPHTFGGGVSWSHGLQWTIAADMTYEKWADCKLPVATTTANSVQYTTSNNQYNNRSRFALGAEYIPNIMERNRYAQTIRYRLGMNYTTPYTKINGQDGPKEFRLTAGLGLPLQTRRMSGRSMINVSAEWMLRKPSVSNMITENYLMLNIGVTFHERWFMKWKIE